VVGKGINSPFIPLGYSRLAESSLSLSSYYDDSSTLSKS
jgi:hypothetical protein